MINMRCVECGATSQNGGFSHTAACHANNFVPQFGSEQKPPAIAIEFSSEAERRKFMKGLTSGSGAIIPSLPDDSIQEPLSDNPSPSKGLLDAADHPDTDVGMTPNTPQPTVDEELDDALNKVWDHAWDAAHNDTTKLAPPVLAEAKTAILTLITSERTKAYDAMEADILSLITLRKSADGNIVSAIKLRRSITQYFAQLRGIGETK